MFIKTEKLSHGQQGACVKFITFGNIRVETNFASGISAVESEWWIDTKQCRMYADLS